MNRHWTPEQIEELRDMYPGTGDVEALAARFNTSVNSVRQAAYRYGIRRREAPASRDSWTEERTRYLVDHIGSMTYEEIAEHLKVTPTTVRIKATKLGMARPFGWTDERVAQLRAEVGDVGVREMARRLGLSVGGVREKVKELGLTAAPPVRPPARRVWTEERIDELLADYSTIPHDELAARYGLTRKSMVQMASRFRARRAAVAD